MNTAQILESLERIKGLAQAVTTPDGSIPVVETKVAILLELCEQLLQDAQKQTKRGDNESSD